MTLDELREMSISESKSINPDLSNNSVEVLILRVPNGWIYSFREYRPDVNEWIIVTSIFVPYYPN